MKAHTINRQGLKWRKVYSPLIYNHNTWICMRITIHNANKIIITSMQMFCQFHTGLFSKYCALLPSNVRPPTALASSWCLVLIRKIAVVDSKLENFSFSAESEAEHQWKNGPFICKMLGMKVLTIRMYKKNMSSVEKYPRSVSLCVRLDLITIVYILAQKCIS